jgi:hypothetical protein
MTVDHPNVVPQVILLHTETRASCRVIFIHSIRKKVGFTLWLQGYCRRVPRDDPGHYIPTVRPRTHYGSTTDWNIAVPPEIITPLRAHG